MIPHLQNIRAVVVVAMVLVSAATPAAQTLTEAESLRLGLARGEVAELARGRIGAATADAQEAGLWANPTLEYARDRGRDGATAREESWRIAQTFDLAGRRGLQRAAGEQRIVAAAADARLFRSELAAEIRRGFFELVLHEAQLAAVEAWVQGFADIERIVGKLRSAGEASGYDLRRLARERQAAQARRAQTQAGLERAREQFAALLGTDLAQYAIAGDLLPAAPADLAALLARLDARPDLAALAARASAAELEQRAAQRGWIPEVTVGVGTKLSDDNFNRQASTLFSVAIPLPVFDRQQAGASRAAAQAGALHAERALARSRAAGQVRGLHRQATQLVAAAADYRRAAVAPSAELVRIAEAAYRGGEASVLELLDAYRGALEAQATALELEWAARTATIELDQLTGSHSE